MSRSSSAPDSGYRRSRARLRNLNYTGNCLRRYEPKLHPPSASLHQNSLTDSSRNQDRLTGGYELSKKCFLISEVSIYQGLDFLLNSATACFGIYFSAPFAKVSIVLRRVFCLIMRNEKSQANSDIDKPEL